MCERERERRERLWNYTKWGKVLLFVYYCVIVYVFYSLTYCTYNTYEYVHIYTFSCGMTIRKTTCRILKFQEGKEREEIWCILCYTLKLSKSISSFVIWGHSWKCSEDSMVPEIEPWVSFMQSIHSSSLSTLFIGIFYIFKFFVYLSFCYCY